MPQVEPDHYAVLGLDRDCTTAQVRAAFRALAKKHHPDLHVTSLDTATRMEAINAAHETLSDSARRRPYDRKSQCDVPPTRRRIERNIAQDVNLRIEEVLRGTELEIHVKDPAHQSGETYSLQIPAGTAPSARFRIPRDGSAAGGFVNVRVRLMPHFRFKVRGSDLRCDLRISAQRAREGGTETVTGALGGTLRVKIPRGVARGELLRIAGEGLPKARSGRGDLLVRVTYRPEVRVSRSRGR